MLKATSNVRRFLTTTAFIGASLLATAPAWADLGAADSACVKNYQDANMRPGAAKKKILIAS